MFHGGFGFGGTGFGPFGAGFGGPGFGDGFGGAGFGWPGFGPGAGFGPGFGGTGFGGAGFHHRGKLAAAATAALLLDGPADAAEIARRVSEATEGAFTPPDAVAEISIGLLAGRGLATVDDGVATLTIALDLQVGPMETPQGKMSWKEGGKFVLNAEGKVQLEAGKHAEGGKMTGSFGGTIDAGGATVVLDMTMEETSHTESGGEVPPVK